MLTGMGTVALLQSLLLKRMDQQAKRMQRVSHGSTVLLRQECTLLGMHSLDCHQELLGGRANLDKQEFMQALGGGKWYWIGNALN